MRSTGCLTLALALAAGLAAPSSLSGQELVREGYQAEGSFHFTTLLGGAYPDDETGLGAQAAVRRVWPSGLSVALGGTYSQPEDLSLPNSSPRKYMEEFGGYGELRYQIPDLRVVRPYAGVRAGWQTLRAEHIDGASGSGATAGLFVGTELQATDRFGFRLDVSNAVFRAPGLIEGFSNSGQSWSVEAGLTWFFGTVERDSDGDGVEDGRDACRGTPRGLEVGPDGCPPDSDGDGRPDIRDACPDTPPGAEVNARGCAADSDDDGVPDARDECAGTPAGMPVDDLGCVADAVGDGVPDRMDACPDTPEGNEVDARGCTRDADDDGVPDARDRCPGTLPGLEADEQGCSEVQAGLRAGRFTLQGLPFRFKAVQVNEDLERRLEQIGSEMRRDESLELEIRVHTDTLGPASYNREMSQRLADAARDYLLGRFPELGAARVEAVGVGEEPAGGGAESAASGVVFVVRGREGGSP